MKVMSMLRYFLPNGGDILLNFTHTMDFFAEWKAADSENNFLYHLFWFLYYNNQFKMHNNFKQTKSKRTGQSPLNRDCSMAKNVEASKKSCIPWTYSLCKKKKKKKEFSDLCDVCMRETEHAHTHKHQTKLLPKHGVAIHSSLSLDCNVCWFL